MITPQNFNRFISKLRSKLLLTQPFYGKVALYLKYDFSEQESETAYTDGFKITLGLPFFNTLSAPAQLGVLTHEISHCIYRHRERIGSRDPHIWNIACDAVINKGLVDAGFILPEGGVHYPWVSISDHAEAVYKQLIADGYKPPPNFKFFDLRECEETDEDPERLPTEVWRAVINNIANQCKREGTLPNGARSLAIDPQPGKLNWKKLMEEFLAPTARGEPSWNTPNRRLIQAGVYVPSYQVESNQCIAVAVDVSGSIDEKELAVFVGELNNLKQRFNPEKVIVFYVSSRIHRVDTFEQGESLVIDVDGMGGGTCFDPAFLEIEKNYSDVEALVYFTDGYGSTKTAAPSYPVIWVVTTKEKPRTDFGFIAHLEDY